MRSVFRRSQWEQRRRLPTIPGVSGQQKTGNWLPTVLESPVATDAGDRDSSTSRYHYASVCGVYPPAW